MRNKKSSAILIPITTAFRVCDIWRGYWAQRLLWDIGGSLCFTLPNVRQDRNMHNLMRDFSDEVDLYLKSGFLATLLGEWRSNNPLFSERMLELTEQMVAKSFWGDKEIELVDAWIQDLKDIGYQFPVVVQ
jgi:hypothetical protein